MSSCRAQATLNPHHAYADKDQLAKAVMVVVRPLKSAADIRILGEPTTQTPIPIQCRCLQTPCQHVLPDDWMACVTRPDEPALATALWSMPTMGSSAMFGDDEAWPLREAYLKSSRVSVPAAGELSRNFPDIWGTTASADAAGASLTFGSYGSGMLSGTFGSATLGVQGVMDGLESSAVLSEVSAGGRNATWLNTMVSRHGGPAASPVAACVPQLSPVKRPSLSRPRAAAAAATATAATSGGDPGFTASLDGDSFVFQGTVRSTQSWATASMGRSGPDAAAASATFQRSGWSGYRVGCVVVCV